MSMLTTALPIAFDQQLPSLRLPPTITTLQVGDSFKLDFWCIHMAGALEAASVQSRFGEKLLFPPEFVNPRFSEAAIIRTE